VAIAAAGQLGRHPVGVGVLGHQGVHRGVGHRVDPGDEVVDPVGVDRDAEPELGLHLVALGHGDVAHVVSEPGQPQPVEVVATRGGTDPVVDPGDQTRVAAVPGHRLAGHPQPGLQVAELAVAVRGLVQVHEVHVDRGPGQGLVELGVQVQQRLAQHVQPGDPHLGRREGVHPGDHAQAVRVGVGLEHHPADGGRLGEHRLADDLGRQPAGRGQRALDLRGLLGDLVQGLAPVEVLAAGEEPHLWLADAGHDRSCP
jgi:hypothetical protein